ncbi:MAG: MMPL family transporter, partial [Burkholderiaceae bacterium]
EKVLFDHRYLLGDAATAGRLSLPGLRDAIVEGLEWLSSPIGLVYRDLITRDPTGEMIRMVDRMQPAQSPRVIEGAWASADGSRAILLVRLDADGTAIDRQQAALERIAATFDRVRGQAPAQLRMTGTARFSVESRAGIEHDVAWLSGIGTGLIVLLLLVVYRSPTRLLLGLIPVATGALAGVAAVAVVFGKVHAITLGFGVALIGESIDYAIYLFVQGSSPKLWRTVRLGVLTSLIGFSSLLSSSFPGLAQLGCFAVSGILVAALVSRFLLAPLVAAEPTGMPPWLLTLARSLPRLRRWRRVPLAALAVAAVTIVAVAAARPIWQSSLEALSPIADLDRQLDATLRSDLRAPDIRHVVAVRGASEDAVLAAAATVAERLEPLVADGTLGGVQSPSTWLPAAATQRQRRAALPDRQTLIAALDDATAGLPLRPGRLAPFVDDVVHSRELEPLTAADLGASDIGLGVTSLLVTGDGGVTAMLPLQAASADGTIDAARVRSQLFDQAPPLATTTGTEVHLLDLKRETDALYAAYLGEALTMAAVGAVLIVALLALSLRRRAPVGLDRPMPSIPARGAASSGGPSSGGINLHYLQHLHPVLLPLVAAVVSVVGLLAVAGVALTILHLVGLLLTVAVGSNYTLFFADRNDDPRVLASLLLANLTTIIGFGILGFSSAPVLAAIGQTVGPGAALSLLFGAMTSNSPDGADTAKA